MKIKSLIFLALAGVLLLWLAPRPLVPSSTPLLASSLSWAQGARGSGRFDYDDVERLYRLYGDDVRRVTARNREWLKNGPRNPARQDMREHHCIGSIGTVEAEIVYMRLRAQRPRHVAEIGCMCGWSTMYLLAAVADNAFGDVYSFDRVAVVQKWINNDTQATAATPIVGFNRWHFVYGDVAQTFVDVARGDAGVAFDALFIDALHKNHFSKMYTRKLLEPIIQWPTTVFVHDVYNPWLHSELKEPCYKGVNEYHALRAELECLQRITDGYVGAAKSALDTARNHLFGPDMLSGEGEALVSWLLLSQRAHGFFTVSPYVDATRFDAILDVRQSIGFEDDREHMDLLNPGVFFYYGW